MAAPATAATAATATQTALNCRNAGSPAAARENERVLPQSGQGAPVTALNGQTRGASAPLSAAPATKGAAPNPREGRRGGWSTAPPGAWRKLRFHAWSVPNSRATGPPGSRRAGSGQYQPPGAGGPPLPSGFPPRAAAPAAATDSGNAIASLVLGILGLILCPIVCSVLAIVFGQQARGQIERDPNLTGAGLAQAGYIMGIVGLVLYGLLILFWILAIAAAG